MKNEITIKKVASCLGSSLLVATPASASFSTSYPQPMLSPDTMYISEKMQQERYDLKKILIPDIINANIALPITTDNEMSPDEPIAIPVIKSMVFKFGKPHRQDFF
jgi:hypothetical protein